jgi:ectoine hydroxylase-related dioxygenase (phytanoyl-CoA dioxygenase family)
MLKRNEIIVIDDAISPQYQDYLENRLLANTTSWFFSADVAFDNHVVEKLNLEKRCAFSKTFFSVGTGSRNDEFDFILPMVFESCDKIGFQVEQTLFSRSFFTMPIPNVEKNSKDHIHVDTIEPHMVCLYYVNDADGDTVLYDHYLDDFLTDPVIKEKLEMLDYSKPGASPLFIVDENIDKSTFKEVQRVTPKKGRMVFFNGYQYHTSSRPSSGYRMVINNCVRGQFK